MNSYFMWYKNLNELWMQLCGISFKICGICLSRRCCELQSKIGIKNYICELYFYVKMSNHFLIWDNIQEYDIFFIEQLSSIKWVEVKSSLFLSQNISHKDYWQTHMILFCPLPTNLLTNSLEKGSSSYRNV